VAYSDHEVRGTVGLYVGLTSFNVTLLGSPEFQNTTTNFDNQPDNLEQINYNEQVQFGERQGQSPLPTGERMIGR
jgi:hypothetical protein